MCAYCERISSSGFESCRLHEAFTTPASKDAKLAHEFSQRQIGLKISGHFGLI